MLIPKAMTEANEAYRYNGKAAIMVLKIKQTGRKIDRKSPNQYSGN